MTDAALPTAAAILGRNALALRGELKTEAVAAAVRAAGLRSWNTGRVAHLEGGRVSPTVTTLYALARAFTFLRPEDAPVTIADLFAGDGPVALGDGTVVELKALRSALSGSPTEPLTGAEMVTSALSELETEIETWPPRLREEFGQMPSGWHIDTTETFADADLRIARSLGITRSRAIAEMALLWHRSLSAERDDQAGTQASQQKRGRITRKLKQRLEEAVVGHDR